MIYLGSDPDGITVITGEGVEHVPYHPDPTAWETLLRDLPDATFAVEWGDTSG